MIHPFRAHRSARRPLAGSTRTALVAAAVLTLLTLVPHPGSAMSYLDALEIHGFGGWAYGNTDGNSYTVGSSDGKYDNAHFALNISARPSERLSLVAQVFFESDDSDSNTSQDASLDYAFAEWFVSDALKIRMGRVKHPFGLYGEIFDVGTLRPFYLLPQSLYGPNGFTAKAYNGIGLTGNHDLGAGWGLQYDLYGGEIEGDFNIPGLLSVGNPDITLEPEVAIGFTVNDTVGGRLVFSTPIDGLSLGASAYRGDERVGAGETTATRKTWVAHAEYLNDPWTVRGEWGKLVNSDQFQSEGGYFELAYKVTEHWQLAGRYDDWDATLKGTDLSTLPGIFSQLLKHEEVTFGVNYWFNPSFVVRLDVHQVTGNRFAFVDSPEQVLDALTTDTLDDQTRLIVLGAQFSF